MKVKIKFSALPRPLPCGLLETDATNQLCRQPRDTHREYGGKSSLYY
jgi:hypothetical protein